MTDNLWKIVIWTSFALGLTAQFFLNWDASNINDLKARVAELEEKLE